MEAKDNPSTPAPEYNDLMVKLALAHALDGGRSAMIAAGETYLPKFGAEDTTDYTARLNASFLWNMYKMTKAMLTGEVFDKPVTLGEDTPDQIKEFANNIDMQGNNLSRFCRAVFHDGIGDGSGWIMVDSPPLPKDKEGNEIKTNQAQDKTMKRRPYWVHIPAKNLINAGVSNTNGILKLEYICIKESVKEQDGAFGEKVVEQVRVVYLGKWEIWREQVGADKKGEWVVVDQGTTAFLDKIPIAPFFSGKKMSFWTAEPPLSDLAELTLEHWQSYSDQKHILHFIRVALLFGKNLQVDENGKVIRSAGNLMHADNPDADLKYVEHTGKGAEAGDKDITQIEKKSGVFSMALVMNQKTGTITATERAMNGAQSGSFLNDSALGLQDTINTALGFTAEMLGLEPGKATATVNTDFSITMGMLSNEILLKSRMNKDIDHETYITELIRRGELPEGTDVVEMAGRLENDARKFGSLGMAGSSIFTQ